MTRRVCLLIFGVIAATPPATPACAAEAVALWESSPYRVAIDLDLQQSGLEPPQQTRLASRLREKIGNRLGRFWNASFADPATPDSLTLDKRLFCRVTAHAGAIQVEAYENDLILHDQGPTETLTVAELQDLPERVFDAVLRAFRPVARFKKEPGGAGRVLLDYRAAELRPESGFGAASEGELMLPFRRRLGRDGNPLPDTVEPVRWTYLVAESDDRFARVASHSSRALARGLRGRFEQLALLGPVDPRRSTRLRLHTPGEQPIPLPGYEVLIGDAKRTSVRSLGYSDASGEMLVPSSAGVLFAHIRCGTLYVASVPVAPGVDEIVDVPLIDERPRLRAELEVTSLRERLIDTVARRKILGQRIQRAIKAEQVDTASQLLVKLDELPGRTQFSRELDQAERAAVAPNAIARKRLETLFSTTRQLVNAALDPRELRDITLEVDTARRQASTGSTAKNTPSG